MSLLKLVEKIVYSNEWLSGLADFRDGDILELVNKSETFIKEPIEYTDLSKLFRDLNNYEGVYRYRNLLFFNDMQYGCFVYDINQPDSYIEHLSIHAMSLESFIETVESLLN